MGFGADFPAVAAAFAALTGVTLGGGDTGARLGAGLGAALARVAAATGTGWGARVDVFLAGGGDVFLGAGDFTDADVVAFFLGTEAVRAAGGADLAGDRVTGFSSQRGYTVRARNSRHFGSSTLRSLRIAKRGGL